MLKCPGAVCAPSCVRGDREEGTSEGAADWATDEPDPEEYMHYIDWDRFDAEGITGATA